MKKRILFIYRYFRTSQRWRRWINTQSLMVVVVALVFLITLAWTAPYSASQLPQQAAPRQTSTLAQPVKADAKATATVQKNSDSDQPRVEVTPTRTPYPPEYLYNTNQTIGVTLAGTALVLIVVVGVLLYIPKKNEE